MDGTIAQLPQMENSRIPHQAMQWKRRGYKQHGWPRKSWMDVVKCDLKDMDITMEEAEVLAADMV